MGIDSTQRSGAAAGLSAIGTIREYTNEVTARDVRHFAQAIGDDNPSSPDGSSGTGPMVVPPLFCQVFAFADLPIHAMPADLSPIEAAVAVPAERTVGGSSRYEFFEPIQVGDVIRVVSEVKDVVKKEGAAGDLYLVIVNIDFFNQDDVLVAREEATFVRR